jgi:phenylacetate-CoA ligase
VSDLRATRVGLNLISKSLAGLPFRRFARKVWDLSEDQFWAYQLSAFRAIYDFARAHVPYYRSLPGEYPPLPSGIGSVREALAMLPVLSKDTVRAHNTEFWPDRGFAMRKEHRTSGTTGTPLRLQASLAEKAIARALYEEWLRRIAGKRLPKSVCLSGFMTPGADGDLFWRDRLLGSIYLSIYSLTEANRGRIVQTIEASRPEVISGYASAVTELARLVGKDLASSRHERIAVVTSEVLTPPMRDDIERSICDRVYDHYGSQEGCHETFQCKCGANHIHPAVGIIEVVDASSEPCPAGNTGRVLVTGLLRRSMPLLRYELGDSAVSTGYDAGCPCGLQWPTIGTVHGRSEDLVRARDGRRVGLLNFHATRKLTGVRETQLVQLGYESFLVRAVVEPDAVRPQIEATVRSELSRRLGTMVKVDFDYVSEIPREARGKLRAVIVQMSEGNE